VAEDQDHLAAAAEAVRLRDLAIELSDDGRRGEALAAAEEAATLHRALAVDYPALFGRPAEEAEALVAAIREDRPRAPAAVPTAPRPREPRVETTTTSVSAAGSGRPPEEPTAVATPAPESPKPRAPEARRRRSRRRTAIVAAVVAVLLGAVGAVGWALSRPPAPAPAPVPPPPPAAAPALPWVATARPDVAPTGVALRSAPSATGNPVGRASAGAEIPIQCGQIGTAISTETGERSSSWLRTTAGAYVAAVNVVFRGPEQVTNCAPGRPPVPVPHHR
jgi:hypothetical protein